MSEWLPQVAGAAERSGLAFERKNGKPTGVRCTLTPVPSNHDPRKHDDRNFQRDTCCDANSVVPIRIGIVLRSPPFPNHLKTVVHLLNRNLT
jgi:hypothetical protein